ncbi:MAG: cadmium-translocating P-type ATPase, partial [Gemmatimonadetes bacterium]|nr:cadmium-translocating P-type ATPase [Gemmatimonadota bacterium]
LTMLVAALLAGRVLEAHGRRRAAAAAVALVASAPRAARRVTADGIERVPVSALRRGDVVDVGAGDELPADGVVVEGAGQVRTALLTGEAEPVAVAPGDRVHAGTVLVDGAISVRIEAAGADTVLRRMAARLEAAADQGVRPTSLDRIAPWFTAATLAVAVAVFVGWWVGAGLDAAVANAVAVLVVACPCALALSHPLAATAGLGAAARRGLLLRSPDTLAAIADVDLVALDKTGTVTEGALTVLEADDAALRIAAGLERYSSHPAARAVVAEAARRGIPLPRGERVREEPGVGIAGRVDGRAWRLRSGGPGVLLLEGDDGARHLLRLGDALRADAAATIAALRREGLEVVLLTGDHPEAARRIAAAVGVDGVVARMGPAEKAEWVEARRAEGRRVLFAGDGLNDGPALAAADVGIAMAGGAASSVLIADGVVSAASLAPVLAARRAARAARRVTRIAQHHSIAYNALAVGAAAAGLMSPLVAALLMPLSSLVVLWGAARVEALVRREEAWPG